MIFLMLQNLGSKLGGNSSQKFTEVAVYSLGSGHVYIARINIKYVEENNLN